MSENISIDVDVSDEVNFVVNVIKNSFASNVKVFDSDTSEVYEFGVSYEDLGDYIPQLIVFEELELVEDEIKKVLKELEDNQYIYKKEQFGVRNNFARCYDQTDLFWGIQAAAYHDKSYVHSLSVAIDVWKKYFWGEGGIMLRMMKLPFFNVSIPKALSPALKVLSADDHGMFIEIMANQYELTGNRKYLNDALDIYSRFRNTDTFAKYGFFPFYSPNSLLTKLIVDNVDGFSKRVGEFQLVKQNSNLLWGVIKLYKVIEDSELKSSVGHELNAIVNDWLTQFYNNEESVFYTNYNVMTGAHGVDLTCFHIIEILIEMDRLFGNKIYTDVACSIVDDFLKYQSSSTGLIPFLHPKVKQKTKRIGISDNVTWLDSLVDFAIAVIKLGMHAGIERYQVAFDEMLRGIVSYHKGKYGYYCSVDVKTGDMLEPVYSTKMNALVLKLFIASKYKSLMFDETSDIHFSLMDR